MLQDLLCCRTLLGVLFQKGTHARLAGVTELGPWVCLEVDVALEHHLEDLLLCVTPEGRQARQEDVQNDAQTPHICFMAIVLAQYLWRNIVRASNQVSESLPRFEEHAKTKICQLQLPLCPLACQQEVFWLQVSVHHTQLMTVVHDIYHLSKDLSCLLFAKVSGFHNAVKELSTRTQFHRQMHEVLVLVRALQGDYMGVSSHQVHDGNLSLHVFDILFAHELGLRY
mmetsp:Transcript_4831/g.13189  ORF Transcript_4831/g.13189 Transcript_4831/m.13189 type:complete len:226 (-) Transcript_4831:330-1007(-)